MINKLNQTLDTWHLLKHPFYRAWTAGNLTLDHLSIYASQYYHQVNAFPRYVSATHSNCETLAERQVLLANLIDEEHGEGNHPGLWLKFAKGLGLTEQQVKQSELFPETKQLIDTFLGLCQSSYAEGVGALYAYERQVPEVAQSKIDGLKKHYGIQDKDSIHFFVAHLHSDVEHTAATLALINQMNESDQQKAFTAAEIVAKAVWNALTGIQMRTIGHCETVM